MTALDFFYGKLLFENYHWTFHQPVGTKL